MFSHNHRLNPKLLSPTAFDGVKLSFMEWSEEVIACVAVTDGREFIPLLSATASSKDVIESEMIFKGVLSDPNGDVTQKDADKLKAQAENRADEVTTLSSLTPEIASLKNKLEQKKSTLLKADFFPQYTLLHTTTGDPDVMIRSQMTHQFIGSAKTRADTLLKQITQLVEWSSEDSKDALQQYHHWLELFAKYEALSGEEVTDAIKKFEESCSVFECQRQLDTTTWSQVHTLFVNYLQRTLVSASHKNESTLSSSICGFKTFSMKVSSDLSKWERVTIDQMCSRSSFKQQFWVSICQTSIL